MSHMSRIAASNDYDDIIHKDLVIISTAWIIFPRKKTLKVQSVADGVTIQKSINRTYSQMGKPQSGLYFGQYLEPETRW